MALVEWGSTIEIGAKKFDEHHRQLIGIINKLDDALRDPNRHSIVGEILRELNDYTVYHFRAEEEFMRRIQFDGFVSHLRQHHELIKELDTHIEAFLAGRKMEISLLSFLTDWLLKHIMENDRTYVRFARERSLPLPEA